MQGWHPLKIALSFKLWHFKWWRQDWSGEDKAEAFASANICELILIKTQIFFDFDLTAKIINIKHTVNYSKSQLECAKGYDSIVVK